MIQQLLGVSKESQNWFIANYMPDRLLLLSQVNLNNKSKYHPYFQDEETEAPRA